MMKFNLKNRPHLLKNEVDMLEVSRAWGYYQRINAWFEGFEKQVRENLKDAIPEYHNEYVKGYADAMKEILGEDASSGEIAGKERTA